MDLTNEVYFLVLQKLKEKAIELEKLIDQSRNSGSIDKNESDFKSSSGNLSCLEKDLIKVDFI